jgi:hypothetical protein
MPMILKFGLLMESLSSYIFLSQLLSHLTKISSAFTLIFVLSSALRFCLPLVLVCCSGFPLCYLYDKRNFLFTEFLFDSFFEVFPIFIQLLFYILCCLLYFISLLSFIFPCFILVFVEFLSEFIYLFQCLLMFFIFGVLKFLECILYILVNHV